MANTLPPPPYGAEKDDYIWLDWYNLYRESLNNTISSVETVEADVADIISNGVGIPSGTSLPGTGEEGDLFYNTTDGKLYIYTSGSWTLAVPEAGIPSDTTNPASGTEGDLFFNTTDGKLYRYHSGAWTAAVPTVDLTGQITTTQITDGAISTPKLAALAVEADKIAANAITSDKIIANAITAGKILAGAVEADKIAANAVTSDKIIANAITAGKILASAITADKIAANTITTDRLVANAATVASAAETAGTLNTFTAATSWLTPVTSVLSLTSTGSPVKCLGNIYIDYTTTSSSVTHVKLSGSLLVDGLIVNTWVIIHPVASGLMRGGSTEKQLSAIIPFVYRFTPSATLHTYEYRVLAESYDTSDTGIAVTGQLTTYCSLIAEENKV